MKKGSEHWGKREGWGYGIQKVIWWSMWAVWWGRCRKMRQEAQKKIRSKNLLFTSNCEDTTQAVKQRFGVDCLDFSICCCGFFQSTKGSTATLWFIVILFCIFSNMIFLQTGMFPMAIINRSATVTVFLTSSILSGVAAQSSSLSSLSFSIAK